MKCLLINPWIEDFAAFNFWIRPLGLYQLSEWLWERGTEVAMLDCLSPAEAPSKFPRAVISAPPALKHFGRTFARYGIDEKLFEKRLKEALPFDAVLVTSAMSYWYPGVVSAIRKVRQIVPETPVVLGGIYPTLWPEHAGSHSGADLVLAGPIESNTAELAGFLGLPGEPVRKRLKWYEIGLHDHAPFGAIRTARGCPFNCTYCASGKISGGFRPRTPEAVSRELNHLYRMGVRDIAFYDDALLVDFKKHLLPVLTNLVASDKRFRFHTPNGMHAKLLDQEAAAWMNRAGFSTYRLSLETINRARQKSTGNKVSAAELEDAVKCLSAAGVPRSAVGVYLLMGLDGQSIEEVRDGIRFVRSLGIRPYLSEFSPIPGTTEWEKLESAGICSRDMDPVLTNNTVFVRLFSGYTETQLFSLKQMCLEALETT
ncbi:MAG TPA: B12-binding domain-containing radical SAM protein [Thermodesulfobacteriaceae bacterium]|nr:B12-binding domain-containing radical SAM protein [Thermodesulfobacteriaceae bacterium]